MKLKQAILTIMDRDTLKALVETLEISDVDRRSVENMRAGMSRSRRTEPETLLAHLNEKQVKAVCEQLGVSPKGRRKALVERLLDTTGTAAQMPAKPSSPRSVKTAKRNRKQTQKESPPMADKRNTDNRNERQPAPVRLPDPPPGMLRVTRTELVWPGKYNEHGTLKEVPRVSLPFQVIETVNETRATREAKKGGIQQGLFDVYEGKEGDSFEEGWKNKLIWGDNLLVMGSLLEKFAGKIDLIYIDPPFATGADFSFIAEIGDKSVRLDKKASVIEEKAYRDTWGSGFISYLQMMAKRLSLMRPLLSTKGHIVVHIAPNVSPHLRMVLDEAFGAENFRNEVVVHRPITKNLQRQFEVITALPQGHDVLLWYSNQPEARVANLLVPYEAPNPEGYWHRFWSGADRPSMRYELLGETPTHGQWKWEKERAFRAVSNYEMFLKEAEGRSLVEYWRGTDEELEFIRKSSTGTVENWFPPSVDKVGDTVWDDIKAYENRKDYATQKNEELLDRVVSWLSQPDDLVADFFCGSGTALAVAEKLGRRWIGCDLGRWAVHVTRKRLLGIENCKPFEVLNLGKYERQYWQGVTFGEKRDKHLTEQALYEYLAFILKLYGAQPVVGLVHLHGKKGRAMIHINAVDAPVTILEIDAAVDECVQVKQPELHVLGWEWEMGLYDLVVEAARKKGVKLLLLQIPREVMEQQAAAKGDVRFFELAYLEAEVQKPAARPGIRNKKGDPAVQVALKDFVIPNTELIPEEVRSKIKKWSDYIDYWAVDWDFQNDTFMQSWVAFRTRKERKLPLVSDPHAYDKPGKYRILVKVIDIFGNDTSQAFDVEVPLS